MKTFTGYKPQYCGNCNDGFLSKLIESGEQQLYPCECKLKHDKEFLFDKLYTDSNIELGLYHDSKTFENYQEWLPDFFAKELTVNAYRNILTEYLDGVPTKLVLPKIFVNWIFNDNQLKNNLNFFISPRDAEDNKELYHFFSNFIGHILVSKLIPIKLVTYKELISIISDYDKFDIDDFLEDVSVVILTGFFSADMLDDLKTSFKLNVLNRFLFTVMKRPRTSVIVFSDMYLSHIVKMSVFSDVKPAAKYKKVDTGDYINRSKGLFRFLTSKSRVVIF